MNRSEMRLSYLCVIVACLQSYGCLQLDCYQCTDVTDLAECHSFTLCSDDEYCHAEANRINNQTRYTFGCRTKQRCFDIAASHISVAIVGRSTDQGIICSQCCITDACNKHLCTNVREYRVGYFEGLYVRLVGDVDFSGRVEVSQNGSTWGTVCANSFNVNSAKVVCKMLGYPTSYAFYSTSSKSGTGPIFLDYVSCQGIESSMLQCSHSTWGSTSCNHGSDISVTCPPEGLFVRLNGSSSYHGRVEVSFDKNTWDTVCDSSFSDNSAKVVCNMLGYASKYAFYTKGSATVAGPVPSTEGSILTDVSCAGTESSLLHCSHSNWGGSTCRHERDIGVACPVNGLLVRLDGKSKYHGRVEVSIDNTTWGTVCSSYFTDKSAEVVCSMLGYPTDYAFYTTGHATGAGPITATGGSVLTSVQCAGTESSLLHCSRSRWGDSSCTNDDDVGVACPVFGLLVRLNGASKYHGRLEISIDNTTWGTVCDSSFTDKSAQVVCTMMGYPTEYAFYTTGSITRGGPVPPSSASILTSVQCVGTESSLLHCSHSRWGTSTCRHDSDVGVACPYEGLFVRLVADGRLEISIDNTTWGTVCNYYFNANSAKVVCRMLGHSTENAQYHTSAVPGTGPVLLTSVSCQGIETSLLQCSHSRWGAADCFHYQDVAVTC